MDKAFKFPCAEQEALKEAMKARTKLYQVTIGGEFTEDYEDIKEYSVAQILALLSPDASRANPITLDFEIVNSNSNEENELTTLDSE